MNPTPPPEVTQPARPALLAPTPAQPARRRWWPWLLVAIVAVAAVWYFFLRKPAETTDAGGAPQGAQAAKGGPGGGKGGGPGTRGNRPLAPVVAATARTGDISVFLNGLGSAVPLNTVTVRSRVDGQLMRILFKEGQVVKAGELLAEIDPRAFQVQVTQAEGQMARDQAQLTNAQVDLERYRTLFQQDSIAKQQLDTQQALVRQYEGAIKADKGVVDNAKLQLSYARITAPISGRIGLRQVDTGNIVKSGDANGIVVITQLQPITVLFTIPEDNIPAVMKKLQSNEKPPVDAWDRAQKTKLGSGTLLTVDNQIDTTTGTVKLKAQFPNTDYSLFPNQFVNTRMLIDVRRDVVVIPTAGIQRGTQGTFAYVVQPDSSVALRLITVGKVQGEDTEIVSGLKAGDVVVTDGADKLRDGGKVEVAMKDGKAIGGGGRGNGGGRRGGAGGAGGGPGAAGGNRAGVAGAGGATGMAGSAPGAVPASPAAATVAPMPAGDAAAANGSATGAATAAPAAGDVDAARAERRRKWRESQGRSPDGGAPAPAAPSAARSGS